MGKPAFPRILSHRRRLGSLVAIEHRERDVDIVLAARRVEHAPRARPVFDGGAGVRRQTLLLDLRDQQPRRAIDQKLAFPQQPDRLAHGRVAAVGADDQVGLERAPVREHELAVGTGSGRNRAGDDLDPGALRRCRQRIDDGLAHDAEHAAPLPAVDRNHTVAIVAHLAGMGERRALDRRGIGADRREHAQPVLVDVDAGARGAQALSALVHAHAPAALRQSAGRGQAGETRAGDFGVPLHGAILWHRASEGSPRQAAGAMMAGWASEDPMRRRAMARLRHFAVCVKDLDKAAEFYAKVFDLERVGREDLEIGSAIYMTDGVINLALLNFTGAAGSISASRSTTSPKRKSASRRMGGSFSSISATSATAISSASSRTRTG